MSERMAKLLKMPKDEAEKVLGKLAEVAKGEVDKLGNRLQSKSSDIGIPEALAVDVTAFPSSVIEFINQMGYTAVLYAVEDADGSPEEFAAIIENFKGISRLFFRSKEISDKQIAWLEGVIDGLLQKAGIE